MPQLDLSCPGCGLHLGSGESDSEAIGETGGAISGKADDTSVTDASSGSSVAGGESMTYWCFISYRHADNKAQERDWASWLHREIERYEVPPEIVGTKNKRGEAIPSRIYPVFRDEESLSADAVLERAIADALDRSRYLVVLCSPSAVKSRYVADEIRHFQKTGKAVRIIAAIVAGEPGDEEWECFPAPLREEGEPIAADFRIDGGGEGFTSSEAYRRQLMDKGVIGRSEIQSRVDSYGNQLHLMKLKIVAGVLGVPLETLRDRDSAHQLELARDRARTLRCWLAGVVSLLFLAIAGGIFSYTFYRRAANERNQAEEILSFMTFEVRDKLEPYVPTAIRREILQTVEHYYEETGRRRSGAAKNRLMVHFQGLGNQAVAEGDSERAFGYFQEAFDLGEELMTEEPKKVRWKLNHCVTSRKLADVAIYLGRPDLALEYLETASAQAKRMVALADTIAHRREHGAICERLGNVKMQLGRNAEALAHYEEEIRVYEGVVKEVPDHLDHLRDLSIAHDKMGRLLEMLKRQADAAIHYQRSSELAGRLVEKEPDNVGYLRDFAQRLGAIGSIRVALGQADVGLSEMERAKGILVELVKRDPESAEYSRDVWVLEWKVATTHHQLGRNAEALGHFIKVKAQLLEMRRREILAPADEQWIANVEERIVQLDDAANK